MYRILLFLVVAILATAGVNTSYAQERGFYVENGRLYEANGSVFVMRGVNYPHAWFAHQTAASIPAIAATGANTVRVVLSNGARWTRNSAADVQNIINLCKANHLIAVLEVHDCTGWGDTGGAQPQGAVHLRTATQYWIDIRDVLIGQEDYVIINIANEPHGNGITADAWQNDWIEAIQALRAAGLRHTIMVDAANWGQDWQHITTARAPAVMAGDPDSNVVFSVHMYEVFSNAATARAYMDAFVNMGLPLVIGEFAADHFQHTIPAAEIMRLAHERGMGYLGWSWSGNTRTNDPATNLAPLDIVVNNNGQFQQTTLTPWGEILINHPQFGIRATSARASIFTGTIAPPPPPPPPPTAGASLIENGDFSNGTQFWNLGAWEGAAATFSVVDGELAVNTTNGGTANWHVQVLQPGISLQAGVTYTLTFDMYASSPQNNIYVGVGQNHGEYLKFLEMSIASIGTTRTTFTQTFTMEANETNARVELCIGGATGTVFIDNVFLVAQGTTATKEIAEEINETSIESIYPNPFNPVANIVLNIAQNERAVLEIVDINGRVVQSHHIESAGRQTYSFDGSMHASGIYFAVLRTNNRVHRQKMVFLK